MSTVDNVANTDENVQIPDDFFDAFEDSKFLDEIVEIVVPEHVRLIREDEVKPSLEIVTENSSEKNNGNNELSEDDEMVKRCMNEIRGLQESIERRRRRTSMGKPKGRTSYSPNRSNRSGRNRASPRRSPSGPRTRRDNVDTRRDRSRSRDRKRSRSRDRRVSRGRRDRSRSVSPLNQPRTMTFLEELEKKFADKGQDFPEKDLLMKMRAKENGTVGINPYAVAGASYAQCMPTPYMQMPMTMSMYPPYQQAWNRNYMMDPMMPIQHTIQPVLPPQAPCSNGMTTNVIPNNNRAEVIARCREASKVLRGVENKVPKLRFLFTRTSMPMESSEEQVAPLQSRKNVEFELTSENKRALAPLIFFPPRTRELVKILGFNCSSISNRLKLKQFADKVINDIEDIDAQKKRTKERSYNETATQTETYKCDSCTSRELKFPVNRSTQTEAQKKVSIRTQTNEKDYREPVIRTLSRMSPGQLVAVEDFVNLICQPRPSTSTEIFSVREKLMDIYNLSERGSEAIEAEREHESRRRSNNSSSMTSPDVTQDLRASIRGTSEHNMVRIPPPPPLLMNYHMMDEVMIDPEQEEREMRLQQRLRYEESLRLEEQRKRELEWQQHQQLQLQQQQQRQLQREQEENARRQEMDRRNCFQRGNQWNGARGRY